MSPNDVIDRAALLRDLGYTHAEAQEAAIEALIEAGLTNARKTGITTAKGDRVREVLSGALVRLCHRCQAHAAADGRRVVPCGHPTECDRCGGSPNAHALERAWAAMRERTLRKLLVVGGSPAVHTELRSRWPSDLELRIVPGDGNHDQGSAGQNLRWADVVVVLGGSILAHKVSTLYTRPDGREAWKVVTVHRRGVSVLAEEVLRHVELRDPHAT
jgi:hypothetical protein